MSSGAGFQPVNVPVGVSPAVKGRCLFKLGRLRVELWHVPEGESIPDHVHHNVSSRFVFMDRNLYVHRTGSKAGRPVPWRRWYHVPARMAHWCVADRGPARFLNFEWGAQSAAEDFHPVKLPSSEGSGVGSL